MVKSICVAVAKQQQKRKSFAMTCTTKKSNNTLSTIVTVSKKKEKLRTFLLMWEGTATSFKFAATKRQNADTKK